MANVWDDIVKWLDDTSKAVGKEAGDLTQKGSLKLEIFNLSRKLRDNFTELGNQVYQQAFVDKKTDWQQSKKIKNTISRIKRTERQLNKLNAEYKKIGKIQKSAKK
jgi:glutaredoxin 2